MSKKISNIFLIAISCMMIMSGCNDTCSENKNALPQAGFYIHEAEGTISQVTVDSLEVIGAGMPADSVLSPATESKKELYLPFRIDADQTKYVFINRRGGADVRDTVTFDYTRVARFASVECGVSYVFHIHDITSQGVLIDSVVCPNGFIDNANIENLRIYLSAE